MSNNNTIIKRFLENNIINFLDIGSSGSLDNRWNLISDRIKLTGFDPNEEECKRQNNSESSLYSKRFLPYALHSYAGEATLFLTNSIYCYSLLEPNLNWLRRFYFSDLFEYEKTLKIKVNPLDEIKEIKNQSFDVLKIDVQGLEIPILSRSGNLLDTVFYIETENGFYKNYFNETTFSEMSELLLSRGYLLFDINTSHRISRNNIFQKSELTKSQLIWTESIWLKDFISEYSNGKINKNFFTREVVEKTLILCAIDGFLDYGLELAYFFKELGLLDAQEVNELEKENSWSLITENTVKEEVITAIPDTEPSAKVTYSKKIRFLKNLINILPSKLKLAIKIAIN